jgi:NitT/TauT family transport system substrate-binding protein
MLGRIVSAALAAVLGALLTGGPAQAQAPTAIGVSYQPALYWSLPFFIADQRGWWREVGLAPSFSTFPAGPPQVAAAAARTWDVGGTGSAPAVLGAARFNILTIGITNDESAANVVMARADQADAILRQPQSLRGQQVLVTANTTGDFALTACLRRWGVDRGDVQLVNLAQAQIISAFSSGNGALAVLWAPNNYTLAEHTGARTICSGRDVGAAVPGTLIVRADYARENPDLVARFLAVYLRTIAWERANPRETVELMRRFYAQGGVSVSDAALQQEIDTRPTFTLDEQLRIMSRDAGASQVDGWYSALGAYLQSVGTVQQAPDVRSFITDEYMRRIAADARLRAFANNQ